MDYTIRRLKADDYPLVSGMNTGIEDDYIVHAFEHLIKGDVLYGLFIDDHLVSLGGYSLYAESYAMLGRVRSDIRYRGKDLATKLMSHIIEEVLEDKRIQWIGANTQENNLSARRVLEKLGLTPFTTLHGAVTKNIEMLKTGAPPWHRIEDLSRKKEWLDQLYIQPGRLFPYECYYVFPATEKLFKDDEVNQWHFYENDSQTRCLITKLDRKGYQYLHVVYPWSDFMQQEGLWETVSKDYVNLLQHTSSMENDTYIWMDLTKEEADMLPENHDFKLPSPWILHEIR